MKLRLILLAAIMTLVVSCEKEQKSIRMYDPVQSVGFKSDAQTVSVTPGMTQLKIDLDAVIKLDPSKGEPGTHTMSYASVDFPETTAVHGVHYKMLYDFSEDSFLVDLYGIPPVLTIELIPERIIKPVTLKIEVPSFEPNKVITLTLVPAAKTN